MVRPDDTAARLALWLAVNNGGSREARRRFVMQVLRMLGQIEHALAEEHRSDDLAYGSDQSWMLGDLPGPAGAPLLGAVRIFRSLVSGIVKLC